LSDKDETTPSALVSAVVLSSTAPTVVVAKRVETSSSDRRVEETSLLTEEAGSEGRGGGLGEGKAWERRRANALSYATLLHKLHRHIVFGTNILR
jgi:hypothetical protein